MLLLKRCATAFVLFVFFFVVVYFGICMVGGGIAGAKSSAAHPNAPDNIQRASQAGADFVTHNIGTIALASFGVSLIASLGLSFTGILPWCRKPAEPPTLPGNSP